ncbi:MAG: AAA family ATPase [Betaproteobacteria bacterium]|nr:AAA family ATPase [Betaproteobacteria bacterium]
MYEAFFEMKNTPFTQSIPTANLYITQQLDEILGRLETVADKQMFATITADVGCGKTTILRRFRDSLDPSKYVCLYLSDSALRPRWLYNGLLEQLGGEQRFLRGEARRLLHQRLRQLRGLDGKKVVVIIDESHLLTKETLEELRFLLNDEMDSRNPLALILSGQNELWDKLRKQAYAAVRQRIDIKCEIPQMDRSQVAQYIAAHLQFAGGRADIFSDGALDEIFKYAIGAPRAVNKACFHCLMCAWQRAVRIVDDRLVKQVVAHELP